MYLGTLAGPTTKEGTGAFPVNTIARLNQIFMFSYHYLVPIPSPRPFPSFLFSSAVIVPYSLTAPRPRLP